MVATRVGYAGGRKERPTYHDLGDHAEAIQIDFDPSVISYERLLEVFWDSHDPQRRTFSTQYRNLVFVHDGEQERLVAESRDRVAARIGGPVRTEILPFTRFWPAEDYHQKYYLRGSPYADDLARLFPDDAALVASTAAARVNAYCGGDLPLEDLRRELAALGLEARGETRLTAVVRAEGAASSARR